MHQNITPILSNTELKKWFKLKEIHETIRSYFSSEEVENLHEITINDISITLWKIYFTYRWKRINCYINPKNELEKLLMIPKDNFEKIMSSIQDTSNAKKSKIITLDFNKKNKWQ